LDSGTGHESLSTTSSSATTSEFAQNAALGSHTQILEDGPSLIAVSGPHADEGGEILEWLTDELEQE
jgi:hypothetical protein